MVVAVYVGLAVIGCGRRIDNSQHVPAMRAMLGDTPKWVESTPLGKRLWAFERAFYEQRQFLPAWIDGDRTTPQMKELISQLQYSEAHGLDPASYHVQEFEQARAQSQTKLEGTRFDPKTVPELDAKMTYAYLRYAADLLGWGARTKEIYENWLIEPKKDDLAARLSAAIADNHVRDTLEELAPIHPQYKGLQAALAIEKQHPTGHEERLKMNLERWRWAPRDLGDRYILVNIPSYELQVVEGDQPKVAMRVVVGKPDTPTPLFSDEMTYVVFSPSWNVPESIIRKELQPRLVNNPDYLRRMGIEVVGTSGEEVDPGAVDWSDESATAGLKFRQPPGEDNALGGVKFVFPNHFSIFLHDTPTTKFFARPQRAFSHGCIRVEDPVALARYVLGDQPEWTEPRIVNAMHTHSEQVVNLKRKIPVHIGYWTAWVEPDGKTVSYTDDPYHIDEAQARVRQQSSGTAPTQSRTTEGQRRRG
jgi:murein L,D-transpeptidase YcbB/YkuD